MLTSTMICVTDATTKTATGEIINKRGKLLQNLGCKCYQDNCICELQVQMNAMKIAKRKSSGPLTERLHTLESSDLSVMLQTIQTYQKTGIIDNQTLHEDALDLLKMSVKYDIPSLTTICVTFLAANPNVKTAHAVLVVSHSLDLPQLVSAMESFVYDHMREVMGHDDIDMQMLNELCKKRKKARVSI